MEHRKKVNLWRVIGVLIAAALLMYWLFAGTEIEEKEGANAIPIEVVPIE